MIESDEFSHKFSKQINMIIEVYNSILNEINSDETSAGDDLLKIILATAGSSAITLCEQYNKEDMKNGLDYIEALMRGIIHVVKCKRELLEISSRSKQILNSIENEQHGVIE